MRRHERSAAAMLLVLAAVLGFLGDTTRRLPRLPPVASERDEVQRAAAEWGEKLGELMNAMQSQWVNGGWQLRKRPGKLLPEIVGHGGSASTEVAPAPTDANWLTSGSEGSRALVSPGMPEGDRELAVAGEFSRFLGRTDVSTTYERRADGAVVFASESALAASVALFAIEMTKELGAAARALARYVDDLEVELARADATAVRLKAEVEEAAKRAQEKTETAERAVAEAEALRVKQTDVEQRLSAARAVAEASEDRAEKASKRVLDLESATSASSFELSGALDRAAELEADLARAQTDLALQAEEARLLASRVDAAESVARAARRERDAVDGVAKAMERRALAAEQTAVESMHRLESALLETAKSEARLTEAIDDGAGDDEGVVEARDAVRDKLDSSAAGLPSIWKMRKSELAEELASYGRDPAGLKVPELRASLRVERLKRKNDTEPDAAMIVAADTPRNATRSDVDTVVAAPGDVPPSQSDVGH